MQLLLGASVLVLGALCFLETADSSAYDKIVSHSRIRARSQGPNMCALQQVLGTKKKYFSTCRNWYKGSICGKKATVVYECCPGYMELEGMKGCPAVAPIEHVYGTLGLVKATTTQRYADMSKVREELEGKGSYTLFAPSNDAWDDLDRNLRSALEGNVNIELFNALHYHMVNRRLLTKDLRDGITVKSMYNDLGLHINHYPNGVVTVNCARIIHGNQVSTNGVVHVIDRVISTVSNNIKDFLEVTDELSSFNTVAVASGVIDKLDQPGHFTLFAPTNDAFAKLPSGYIDRIMDNNDVLQALVNYHLLTSAQCSEAIMAGTLYETAEGTTIEIGCDGDSLTVNGIKMVLKKDIVTTNGVIHLIDQVLIPNSAKEVMELTGETQSTFTDMVSELGLAAALGPKAEYTLLAPLNSAFTNEVMSTDQNELRQILENHILKLKVTLGELYNGQTLETLAGKLLRVFIYRTAVCLENACMIRGSKEGSNGALHLLRTIINVPEKSLYEILVTDGRFRIFLNLMETAGLTDLLRQEGSYTIFAPTDEAFSELSQDDIALLKSDVNVLRTILLYHFSNGVFINGGLEGGVTNLLKSMQGNNLQVMSANNTIHVNSINVPDSDLMATNGVVHVVKNVLYPGDLPVGRQDILVLLKKLIKYITLKFQAGFSYSEIPLTFIKRTITTTHYIETVPETTKVIRVIEEPSQKTFTQVIEGEPKFTKVTRVIETEPVVTEIRVETDITDPSTLTRVIGGDVKIPENIKKTIKEEIEKTISEEFEKIEKTLSEPSTSMVVAEGESGITKVTRVVKPTFTKVTRVIQGADAQKNAVPPGEGPGLVIEPFIIEGPDFSKITTIHGNPDLIEEESERITKIIKEGGKYASARKAQAIARRRARLARRHHKPRE
ncbi:periostin [Boleophthalmus pectinirostris]|uniref:periostin n=1 Tax=Boleophthalmus pectinirostris TaxID=150288 RepID=UPI002430D9F4|nr:periostin [Boleophthalmus pectinirostris]